MLTKLNFLVTTYLTFSSNHDVPCAPSRQLDCIRYITVCSRSTSNKNANKNTVVHVADQGALNEGSNQEARDEGFNQEASDEGPNQETSRPGSNEETYCQALKAVRMPRLERTPTIRKGKESMADV